MNNDISNPINLVIIVIGLFLGLTLGIFLLLNKSAKNSANVYLGFLILLSVCYFGQGFLLRFDLLEKFPHIIGTPMMVNFLIGPLTYLYVRACTQKGFQMRPILWLHFLPVVLVTLYELPFFLQSGSEKIIYLNNLVENGGTESNLFWERVAVSFHSIIYFGLAINLLFQYKKHLNNMTSSIDRAFHSWVFIFIIIHAIPVITAIFSFVFNDHGNYTFLVLLLGFFIFSLAVYIAILVKPELFHSFPHQMLIPESTEDKTQKYENSNLQEEKKDKFLQKVLDHIDKEKPFLSQELTLKDLAEQTKIPPHHLSQVINEKASCNFLDFINSYRVEEAKKLLSNDTSKQFTILSIAYDAGFNSKSTFYSAFKKHAGTTPSGFRKSVNFN